MSNYKTVFFTLGILQIILGAFMIVPVAIQFIMMFKSWIRDITEKKKVKRASETGIYGVSADQREVGTSAQRRYAQSMVPGQEEIINFDIKEFLNKYRKKRS